MSGHSPETDERLDRGREIVGDEMDDVQATQARVAVRVRERARCLLGGRDSDPQRLDIQVRLDPGEARGQSSGTALSIVAHVLRPLQN